MGEQGKSPYEELRLLFLEWKAKSSKRSLSLLSKRTGITNSTLHRFLEGAGEITLDKVILVLEEICTPTQRVAYFNKYFPQFSSFICETYQVDMNTSQIKSDEDDEKDVSFNRYFSEMPYFQVLSMLPVEKEFCISYEKIEKELGHVGTSALADLVEKGFVNKSKDGKYSAVEVPTANYKTLIKLVENSCKRLSQSNLTYNVAAHFSTVSDEGIKALSQALKRYNSEIVSIIKDHKGDIPISCNALLGIMDSENSARVGGGKK